MIERHLKAETVRRDELSQWGFGSYVISYKVKVRMMEELIDKAQRLKLKPDKELKEEVQKLTVIRDQTFEDLHKFINSREKHHWRNWDKLKEKGFNYDRGH